MSLGVKKIALSADDHATVPGRKQIDPFLLSQFYTGNENRFAWFVSQQAEPIHQRGNPLLLFGPSGSGKTALAVTIASQEAHQDGERKLRWQYVLASDFARQYAAAIAADDLEHFRQRLLRVAILVVDDVHAIADKPTAQQELATRIEARVMENKTTILTCRRLPFEIRGLRPYLASRMVPGLSVPLALPGALATEAIFRQLLRKHQLQLDPTMADLIVRSLPEKVSVPRLAALVQQMCLLSEEGSTPDLLNAAQSLMNPARPTLAAIAKAVAKRFQLKVSELKSNSRRQQVVRARSLAIYLSRQLTDRSLQQIGAFFGGRDHSTILHSCRKIELALPNDNQLNQAAQEVLQQYETC